MGIGIFRDCSLGYDNEAPAPNPNPLRWTIVRKVEFDNAYVLKVVYHGCTNYEGRKVMVFIGKYKDRFHRSYGYKEGDNFLDPHFCEGSDSPIARFKPTEYGWNLACNLAKTL